MVKIGSKNNPTFSGSLLAGARQFYNAAELRSKDRKQYAELLTKFANIISSAISNKDINQLYAFADESYCRQHAYGYCQY